MPPKRATQMMPPLPPPHNPSPSSSRRPKLNPSIETTTAQAELVQILNLLSLAYHRNKNQHRRSRWWKELSLLRRNLRRVVGAASGSSSSVSLAGNISREAKQVSKAKPAAEREVEEKEKRGKESGERTRFLKVRLIPRCWVAFTGLVGDNQYAALGLMLLGLLGRLARVVGWDVEVDREGIQEGGEAVEVGLDAGGEREMMKGTIGEVREEEDLGVPLRRDEVMRVVETQGNGDERKAERSRSEAVSLETGKISAKVKRKKKHGDAIDELFSGLI